MNINEEIFDKAKMMMGGEFAPEAEGALREMCQAAYLELHQNLKRGVYFKGIRERFIRASAILAMAMFIEMDLSPMESFSAGGVSMRKRGDSSRNGTAASLRRQAELMLLGYLKERGFDFRAVRP